MAFGVAIVVYAMDKTREKYQRQNLKRPVIHTRLASPEHLQRLEKAVVVAGSSSVAEWVRTVLEREVEETLTDAE